MSDLPENGEYVIKPRLANSVLSGTVETSCPPSRSSHDVKWNEILSMIHRVHTSEAGRSGFDFHKCARRVNMLIKEQAAAATDRSHANIVVTNTKSLFCQKVMEYESIVYAIYVCVHCRQLQFRETADSADAARFA